MTPTKEEVAGAVERLTRHLPDLDAAAIPTKCEVFVICGGHARRMHLDLTTLLQAYASETAAREAAEAARDEALTFVLNARSDQEAAERSLGEALEKAAQICEQQAREFADPAYAAGQPLGSFAERFACAECAKAIRSLKGEPTDTGVR